MEQYHASPERLTNPKFNISLGVLTFGRFKKYYDLCYQDGSLNDWYLIEVNKSRIGINHIGGPVVI